MHGDAFPLVGRWWESNLPQRSRLLLALTGLGHPRLIECESRSTVGTSSEADSEPHRLNGSSMPEAIRTESEAENSTEPPAFREVPSTRPWNIRCCI